MKKIILISFVFLFLLISANAEEVYNCKDSKGNTFITSNPQDGMSCAIKKSEEESSNIGMLRDSKMPSSINLVEKCSKLSDDLSETNNEITRLERIISELKREQLNSTQEDDVDKWGRKIESANTKYYKGKMYDVNKELSNLYQKNSLNMSDIRLYKCNELKNDLSRINQDSKNRENLIKSGYGRY